MNALTLLIVLTLIINTGCTQPSAYSEFINSFPEVNSNIIMKLGVVVGTGPRMTAQESLAYVYENDSTKLFCRQKIFNMETEKVEGISTELYLPQKCLQIKTSKFILIGYSAFECQDPDKNIKQFLILNIIDTSNFQVTDSLLVYIGNDHDWYITGLINPRNNKIFIVEQLGAKVFDAQAFIYRISEDLKFEVEKQLKGIKKMPDDLQKGIELLGWQEAFLK